MVVMSILLLYSHLFISRTMPDADFMIYFLFQRKKLVKKLNDLVKAIQLMNCKSQFRARDFSLKEACREPLRADRPGQGLMFANCGLGIGIKLCFWKRSR